MALLKLNQKTNAHTYERLPPIFHRRLTAQKKHAFVQKADQERTFQIQ
jgi:hypothetical protein